MFRHLLFNRAESIPLFNKACLEIMSFSEK